MRFEIDEANTLFLCFIIYAKLMKLLTLDIINQSLTVIKYNVGLSFFFFERMTSDTRRTRIKICLASSMSKIACLVFDNAKLIIICEPYVRFYLLFLYLHSQIPHLLCEPFAGVSGF